MSEIECMAKYIKMPSGRIGSISGGVAMMYHVDGVDIFTQYLASSAYKAKMHGGEHLHERRAEEDEILNCLATTAVIYTLINGEPPNNIPKDVPVDNKI